MNSLVPIKPLNVQMEIRTLDLTAPGEVSVWFPAGGCWFPGSIPKRHILGHISTHKSHRDPGTASSHLQPSPTTRLTGVLSLTALGNLQRLWSSLTTPIIIPRWICDHKSLGPDCSWTGSPRVTSATTRGMVCLHLESNHLSHRSHLHKLEEERPAEVQTSHAPIRGRDV